MVSHKCFSVFFGPLKCLQKVNEEAVGLTSGLSDGDIFD